MMLNRHIICLTFSTLAIAFPPPSQQPIQPYDHSQGYQFDPLLHLPGTSPYFDALGFGLEHKAPPGCKVNAASYLIRHGAIYANDAEYEDFIQPFLYKLEKHRGGFSGPLEFLNKWQSPIDENHLEDLTPSGAVDAEKVGHHIKKRYPDLVHTVKRVIADTKSRTFDTARSFIKSFPHTDKIEIVRFNKKHLNNGTRALLPHKACSAFSKSPGDKEQHDFLNVYAPPISQRLAPFTPQEYNFTAKDILALQSICGYESAIKGERSPMCPIFTDAEWMSYEYAWDMKYAYMVGPLNKLSNYMGFPWLASQAQLFSQIDGDDMQNDKNPNSNDTTGWPHAQRLFLSFTHREVPPVIATALGIFNSSSNCGNDEFPTTHINFARAWKMSDLIPFLGHVGMEKMICEVPSEAHGGTHKTEYIRFIANTAPRPLPLCQSGPGASCPLEEFQRIMKAGLKKYSDFDGVCKNKKADESGINDFR